MRLPTGSDAHANRLRVQGFRGSRYSAATRLLREQVHCQPRAEARTPPYFPVQVLVENMTSVAPEMDVQMMIPIVREATARMPKQKAQPLRVTCMPLVCVGCGRIRSCARAQMLSGAEDTRK